LLCLTIKSVWIIHAPLKSYVFFIYCHVIYIHTALRFLGGMGSIFRGDFPAPIGAILTLNFRVDVTNNRSWKIKCNFEFQLLLSGQLTVCCLEWCNASLCAIAERKKGSWLGFISGIVQTEWMLYLLTYLLHETESFLRSESVLS